MTRELIVIQNSHYSLSTETPTATILPNGLPMEPKDSRQTEIPIQDFQKSTKSWNRSAGMHVVYAKKTKRITLQRVLISRMVFEKEKITIVDLLTIFDNMLYLQDMTKGDLKFKQKYGSSLEDLTIILKNSRITSNPTRASLDRLSERLRALDKFYLPLRNLASTEKWFKGKYSVVQGTKIGIPVDRLPVKRFIGIGYKDHGTARNLALNGTPTWKEYCRMRLWRELT
jgi:hypothetical protein